MFKKIIRKMVEKMFVANGLDKSAVTDEMFNEIWALYSAGDDAKAEAKIEEMIHNAKR